MSCPNALSPLLFITPLLISLVASSRTPIIGGRCELGTPDVHIGGKQTQFFLRCEPSQGSDGSIAVWVVKSRVASTYEPKPEIVPSSSSHGEQTQRPAPAKYNICMQDSNAQEGLQCSVPMTCLQENVHDPSSFLQCNPNYNRWMRKTCADGATFKFEHQTCVAATKQNYHRYVSNQMMPSGGQSGMVCVLLGCSNSNPCQQGTCSNGYCCSPSSGIQPLMSSGMGSMNLGGLSSAQIIHTCPQGGFGAGGCINGFCGSGYSCNPSSNVCCPHGQQNNMGSGSNPFVCPDGTQAAGACINGKCGGGFACAGGLCCNGTSQNPRCLDGSQAVGACINGKCGGGFTCTTGNICCSSTTTAVPVIPTCPSGGQSIGVCVNNLCPAGHSCVSNQCCPSTTGTCADPTQASGACGAGHTCPDGGFACDTARNLCCPKVVAIGPCVGTACPTGHTCYPVTASVTSKCYQQCAGSGTTAGPAINGNCPAGTSLVFGECCRAALFHSPALASYLYGTQYDSPLDSTLEDSVGTCADGSAVISGCINGECGAGLLCSNNMCCSASSQDALSIISAKLYDASPIEESETTHDSAQIGTNQVN